MSQPLKYYKILLLSIYTRVVISELFELNILVSKSKLQEAVLFIFKNKIVL